MPQLTQVPWTLKTRLTPNHSEQNMVLFNLFYLALEIEARVSCMFDKYLPLSYTSDFYLLVIMMFEKLIFLLSKVTNKLSPKAHGLGKRSEQTRNSQTNLCKPVSYIFTLSRKVCVGRDLCTILTCTKYNEDTVTSIHHSFEIFGQTYRRLGYL